MRQLRRLWTRPGGPDFKRALTEFSRSLTLIVDLDQLLENLVGKLYEIAAVSRVAILLRDPETNRFTLADYRGGERIPAERAVFYAEDKLVQWLTVNETTLVVPEEPGVVSFFSDREQQLIAGLGIEIIVPLIVMNHVNGMVLLGGKQAGEPFTREERELLTTLLSQSALAFENAMLYKEQKSRLRKMFRADRLASIGQIAAGAAHEIRNPLTSMRSTIQYLHKKQTDPEQSEMLTEVLSEVDRIDEIIQGMLSFAKPAKLQKEEIDLVRLIQQVEKLIASTARKNGVTIEFRQEEAEGLVDADPSQIKQVFLNIILNAIQALENGGHIGIMLDRARSEKQPDREYCRIRFRDNGPGIPDDKLDQIFDPFFTTKKEGTGLGLSICYGIVQRHDGEIEINSICGGEHSGTTVSVLLPGHRLAL
ncbi:GAF domain-containing protein [bacterium]|nr:GAF domain-containing protein [bacterium]